MKKKTAFIRPARVLRYEPLPTTDVNGNRGCLLSVLSLSTMALYELTIPANSSLTHNAKSLEDKVVDFLEFKPLPGDPYRGTLARIGENKVSPPDLEHDADAKIIGKRIAEVLGLKPNCLGRYHMRGGDKSHIGLARTLFRILTEGDF